MKILIRSNNSVLLNGDELAHQIDTYLKKADLAADDVWCDNDDVDEILISADFRSWKVADLACEAVDKGFVPHPDICEVSDTSEYNVVHFIYNK